MADFNIEVNKPVFYVEVEKGGAGVEVSLDNKTVVFGEGNLRRKFLKAFLYSDSYVSTALRKISRLSGGAVAYANAAAIIWLAGGVQGICQGVAGCVASLRIVRHLAGNASAEGLQVSYLRGVAKLAAVAGSITSTGAGFTKVRVMNASAFAIATNLSALKKVLRFSAAVNSVCTTSGQVRTVCKASAVVGCYGSSTSQVRMVSKLVSGAGSSASCSASLTQIVPTKAFSNAYSSAFN